MFKDIQSGSGADSGTNRSRNTSEWWASGKYVTYESSVMDVTMIICVVFFPEDQFIGFSGSSGFPKSTISGSSGTGSFATSLL